MVANQNLTQVFEKLVLPVRINFEKIVASVGEILLNDRTGEGFVRFG